MKIIKSFINGIMEYNSKHRMEKFKGCKGLMNILHSEWCISELIKCETKEDKR